MLDPPHFRMWTSSAAGRCPLPSTSSGRSSDEAYQYAEPSQRKVRQYCSKYCIKCALDSRIRFLDMSESWDPAAPGIVRLPSGRLVRGRGLGHPMPDGPSPSFGVYLLGRRPPAFPWESRWIRWPDFRLPAGEADVLPTLTEAWERAAAERVEIACQGGHGRTGTALACLAILDGVPGPEAVAFVREHYARHAVETPAQRRYVARWPGKR
jgi:Swiss Army Knife protein, DSP-PTPase phosphatase domain